jgi:hypothetical protein
MQELASTAADRRIVRYFCRAIETSANIYETKCFAGPVVQAYLKQEPARNRQLPDLSRINSGGSDEIIAPGKATTNHARPVTT